LQEVLDSLVAQEDASESLAFYDSKGRLWRLDQVDEKEIVSPDPPEEIYITNQGDQPSSLRNRQSLERAPENQPLHSSTKPSQGQEPPVDSGEPAEEMDMLAIMHDKLDQEKL